MVNNVRHYLPLILIIILILAISTIILLTYNNHTSRSINATNTINTSNYISAVEEFKSILNAARALYLDALAENKTYWVSISEPYSNFSSMLILNSTVVNGTILSIGGSLYKYVIVSITGPGIYSNSCTTMLNFTFSEVNVDGVYVKLLPFNESVTYTGISVPFNYLVYYRGKTYEVSFASIGLIEASYYLSVSTDKISGGIYKVEISLTRKLGSTECVNQAWFILIKQ